jgi:NitT/TauT family transport system permease protein
MGYYIVDAWSRIDYIGMYSGIIVISIVGFALFAAVDLLSVKLCPWR